MNVVRRPDGGAVVELDALESELLTDYLRATTHKARAELRKAAHPTDYAVMMHLVRALRQRLTGERNGLWTVKAPASYVRSQDVLPQYTLKDLPMHWNHFILDADGNPVECDLLTRHKWEQENPHAYVVHQTIIEATGQEVSTVFLGQDISHGRTKDPVLFETMVFPTDGPHLFAGFQDRYSTRDQADRGHAILIARILQLVGGLARVKDPAAEKP